MTGLTALGTDEANALPMSAGRFNEHHAEALLKGLGHLFENGDTSIVQDGRLIAFERHDSLSTDASVRRERGLVDADETASCANEIGRRPKVRQGNFGRHL